jgi:hypothetical protein
MAKITRTDGPGKEQLKLALAGLNNKVGKVGWFPSARYEDGTPVAYIAAIHEFGYAAGGIKPRPFMRRTRNERLSAWKELCASGARGIVNGSQTTETVLEGLGMQAAGDIQKTISQIFDPQLKPATIKARMRRRSDKRTTGNLFKPLVDTGLMIGTITYTVEDAP